MNKKIDWDKLEELEDFDSLSVSACSAEDDQEAERLAEPTGQTPHAGACSVDSTSPEPRKDYLEPDETLASMHGKNTVLAFRLRNEILSTPFDPDNPTLLRAQASVAESTLNQQIKIDETQLKHHQQEDMRIKALEEFAEALRTAPRPSTKFLFENELDDAGVPEHLWPLAWQAHQRGDHATVGAYKRGEPPKIEASAPSPSLGLDGEPRTAEEPLIAPTLPTGLPLAVSPALRAPAPLSSPRTSAGFEARPLRHSALPNRHGPPPPRNRTKEEWYRDD